MEGEVLLITYDPLWLLPLFLYAETHYRFRYFFSFLRKAEPELIADAPFRVEPRTNIPILFLAKDAHRYPCRLLDVSVTIRQEGHPDRKQNLLHRPISLNQYWWWRIFSIDPHHCRGWIDLDVEFTISVDGKTVSYKNDNFRTSTRKSLRVYVSAHPLPTFPGLSYGDCHVHSNYTDDQVEFGAPIAAGVTLAPAMGLSFFAATDHSYDLDDEPEHYLRNDPGLSKWRTLNKEVDHHNDSGSRCLVLRGEEASCRNSESHTVHMVVLGEKTFFPGSGDSAERWFRTKSELTATTIAQSVSSGLTFAAHPMEHVPLLQKMLLGRGQWQLDDLLSPGLTGVQFLNGTIGSGYEKGKQRWTRALLTGARLVLIAGNDAHGNFNRFRQLGIPFLTIRESGMQIFGKMRTGVFVRGKKTETTILHALRAGNSIITDGPIARMDIRTRNGAQLGTMGGHYTAREATIEVEAGSSQEFGVIEHIRLFCGRIGESAEELVFEDRPAAYKSKIRFPLAIEAPLYVRAEITTSMKGTFDGLPHFCLTNPLWISPS